MVLVLTERLSEKGMSEEDLHNLALGLGYHCVLVDDMPGIVADQTQQPRLGFTGAWSLHGHDASNDADYVAIVTRDSEAVPLGLFRVDPAYTF